ncbi:type II CAAX prenyl endopeptidase Rce1 family protein [Staphylococcus pasteuri]
MYVLNILYGAMVEFLPEKYQFDDTENNKMLAQMFTSGWMWPILFLDIVIVTPIVEELLFRHLLIHELGKKINLCCYVCVVHFNICKCACNRCTITI